MRNFTNFKSIVVLVAIMVLNVLGADAITYEMTKSGSLTTAANWKNATAPPTILNNGDIVIIPQNFVATTNQPLIFNAGSSLILGGELRTLVGQPGGSLTLNTSSTFTGTGMINMDSVYIEQKVPAVFTGTIQARVLDIQELTVNNTLDILVEDRFYVHDSALIMTAGTIWLDTNATIVRENGMLMLSGSASFTNAAAYNVEYRGKSATTGLEAKSLFIKDFTIDMDAGERVTMDDSLYINGVMTLENGELMLGNKRLVFTTSADFSPQGTGTITSTPQSQLAITTDNSVSAPIRFTTGTARLSTLEIKIIKSNARVSIYEDIEIYDELMLTSGRLNIYDYNLTMIAGSKITGGSAASYVQTDNGGTLQMNVMDNMPTIFPVGTPRNYAPAEVTTKNLSVNNIFVGAKDNVNDFGTYGNTISDTQPVVNATWFVESEISSGIQMDLKFMWTADMEVNGFDRNNLYVSHYTNGMWDMQSTSAAGTQGNMYTASRTGVTSLSPFAVFDANTAVSVDNVVENNTELNVYPNPATSEVNITYTGSDNAQVSIYSASGQLVKTASVSGTAKVDISDLMSGVYYIRMNGENNAAIQKFVKQ